MNRFLSVVTMIAVALWLGGLLTLMWLVSGLFARSHELGAEVAPVLFQRFSYYHLIAGGIAVVGGGLWWLRAKGRLLTAAALCIALGMAAALVTELIITPTMQQLRQEGQSGGETFARLHRASEMTYGIETLALLAASGLLPLCIARSASHASPPRVESTF